MDEGRVQALEPCPARLSESGGAGLASLPGHVEVHAQIRGGQVRAAAFGPFHQPEGRLVAVESQELQFAPVADAIEVEVPGLPARG